MRIKHQWAIDAANECGATITESGETYANIIYDDGTKDIIKRRPNGKFAFVESSDSSAYQSGYAYACGDHD